MVQNTRHEINPAEGQAGWGIYTLILESLVLGAPVGCQFPDTPGLLDVKNHIQTKKMVGSMDMGETLAGTA